MARGDRALTREHFARPTAAVAELLVGCRLVVDPGTDGEVAAILVEVEAYLGDGEDEASHAHRGPTPRAAIMFGPPGRLYVYLSYGMHHCANLVTEPAGRGGAVLLRAAAVESGEPLVRRRRGAAGSAAPRERLLRGPGNLCRGLALDLRDNGLDACEPGSRLRVERRGERPPLALTPRVGISRARERPLRFVWRGHPASGAPASGAPPAG